MALLAILPSLTIEQKPEQIVTINLVDIPGLPSSGAAGGPPPKAEKKPPAPPKAEPKPPPPEPKPQPPEPKPLPPEPKPPPPEPKPQPPEPKPLPPEPKPPPKVEPPKPVKETPPPEPPPQVVSLKPQKHVKKMPPEPPKPEVVKPPKKDEKTVRRELDKLREQLAKEQHQRDLSQVRKQLAQEEKLRKEAQAADADAAKLMRELADLKAQSSIMAAREQGLLGSGPASSSADSALAQQYYARITGQLKSLWKLPDYKDWPPNLLATVIVTLDKSGKILDVQFEKRSGDSAFDRLVRKTLDDADPLPPIPPAMKKERLEIGLNFKPGSITGR